MRDQYKIVERIRNKAEVHFDCDPDLHHSTIVYNIVAAAMLELSDILEEDWPGDSEAAFIRGLFS